MEHLTGQELAALIERVFEPTGQDKGIAIMVDLPDSRVPDEPDWANRRAMAAQWVRALKPEESRLRLPVRLALYRNAHRNNADLPGQFAWWDEGPLPATAEELDASMLRPLAELFESSTILLAPTQFSATAPLKLLAPKHGFRAATMPGFSEVMIPALRLDYQEINRRVTWLKERLDRATSARFRFQCGTEEMELVLDLRFRTAHASGGLFPKNGVAGNLPSGEAYIVPYEGERADSPSGSQGLLPVEFPDGLVLYRIENNRAVAVAGPDSGATRREKTLLAEEPAYGNLAELGLGVLSDFGLDVTGEILLDEKLGLHIAFGRSDHFGGQVGARHFSSPDAVVHIDRVYIPATQPHVKVLQVTLHFEDGESLLLMKDGDYAVDFGR